MADVEFSPAVKAYQADGCVREAFCCDAVLRRLYGRVDGLKRLKNRPFPVEAVTAILRKIPGHIYCNQLCRTFVGVLKGLPGDIRGKMRYITRSSALYNAPTSITFPNLLIGCFVVWRPGDDRPEFVLREGRLNGRCIVDVLEAVRRPSDGDIWKIVPR